MLDAFAPPQPPHDHREIVGQIRGNQLHNRLPDHLGRRVAVEALGRPIPARDDALERFADDGVVRGFHNGGEVRPDRLGPPLLGNIAGDLGGADDLARTITQR